MNEKIIKDKLVENILKYVDISSQSDEENIEIPSSPGQVTLGKKLAEDLSELGLVDISINEFGVLQARLPKRGNSRKSLGWVAHLDTVDVGMSEKIHPQIIKSYDDSDIRLNEDVFFSTK